MDNAEHDSEEYKQHFWAVCAHKTMNLSFYGELGNHRGRFFEIKLASSITLIGQFYNKLTMELARRKGYESLYADTDSIFVKIQQEDITSYLKYVHACFDKIANKLNAVPKLMELEYENYYDRIAFLAKKRYFGSMLVHKGKPVKDFMYVRGLETRRNDVPDIAKIYRIVTGKQNISS